VSRERWRVEVITSRERLSELGPAWSDLFEQDARATPFQSPEWLLAWADCFAEHGSLRVVVLWNGERVLLWLPLRLSERDGLRSLSWLGAGVSDYLDVLAAPAAGTEAFDVLLGVLRELATDADQIDLGDLPAHSPLLALPQPRLQLEPAAICPRIEPGSDPEAYLRSMPAWLVRNLKQSERRLRARGELLWRSADAATTQPLLEAFFELHAARWHARGSSGVLAHPSVQAFHRLAAPRLLARRLLALEVLFLDARPVAAVYSLRRADTYLYLTGFDPSVETVSLGSLLFWRTIRRAIQERCEGVDLLRGQEPYKYHWGARDTQTYRLASTALAQQTSTPAAQAACGATGSARPNNCLRTKSA